MSDSIGEPLLSHHVTVQASASEQVWSSFMTPQSMTLSSSCPTPFVVVPSSDTGGFAVSATPQELVFFVHWLCAFLTAVITASGSSPGGVSPIFHGLLPFQYLLPSDAWEELPHETSARWATA